MDKPDKVISFVPAKEGEILRLRGGVECRVQEDGSNTGTVTFDKGDLPKTLNAPQIIEWDVPSSPFPQTPKARRLTGM